MEKINLQLFPVNIFPLLGSNEESPLHFQEGLAAVSWLQAAGTILTF